MPSPSRPGWCFASARGWCPTSPRRWPPPRPPASPPGAARPRPSTHAPGSSSAARSARSRRSSTCARRCCAGPSSRRRRPGTRPAPRTRRLASCRWPPPRRPRRSTRGSPTSWSACRTGESRCARCARSPGGRCSTRCSLTRCSCPTTAWSARRATAGGSRGRRWRPNEPRWSAAPGSARTPRGCSPPRLPAAESRIRWCSTRSGRGWPRAWGFRCSTTGSRVRWRAAATPGRRRPCAS